MKVIRKNSIRCKKCGKVLESKSVHDFQQCECGNFVDGGHDYVRIGGEFDDIEVITEYEEVPSYLLEIKTHYGSYRNYEIEQSKANELINYYEDMWDYVRITDGDEVIYESKGYDKR